MSPIEKEDGWCDEPGHRNYNSPVKLPFDANHEKMYRADGLYDLCLVLDYNLSPQIENRGSAIFFHLESESRKPTEGCIALERQHMLKILPGLSSNTLVHIG